MSKKGRVHSSAFKIKVALTAIREQHTMAEICQMYQLHSSVVGRWKRQLLEGGQVVFEDPSASSSAIGKNEAEVAKLHQKIGELTVERDFLKKVWERWNLKNGGK